MKPLLFFAALTLFAGPLSAQTIQPLHKLSSDELANRQQSDAREVLLHRAGLSNVIQFIGTQPEIFPKSKPATGRLLRREEKEIVWQTWQRLLDYTIALDSTERYHADWWKLKGNAREDSFLISYEAMLAKHRAGLEFIRAAELNPELDKVLNDAVPELGLPAGTYAKLKYRNLNVRIATEFAASDVVLKTFTAGREPELRAAIKDARPTSGKARVERNCGPRRMR